MSEEYHMHKQELELTDPAEIESILLKGKFATIALSKDDQPYVVTLNYGYDRSGKAHKFSKGGGPSEPNRSPEEGVGHQALYFHSALEGLKLDYLAANPKACATVIEDLGYQLDKCTHAYRSVVLWGRMSVVEELDEKKHGMEVMFDHLEENPDPIRERNFPDDSGYDRVAILRFDIERMTGKEGS